MHPATLPTASSRYTLAGHTADGLPVYHAKKHPQRLPSTDLAQWIILHPETATPPAAVRLDTLGLPASGYLRPLPGEPPLQNATRISENIAAFLATIPAALIQAHSNASLLHHHGLPCPDIPACLAMGHDPAQLAEITSQALQEAAMASF